MCGIVGIVGKLPSKWATVEAIKRLEYRGYDSYGFASLQMSSILVKKAVGTLSDSNLDEFLKDMPASCATISHTRWATHGGVTVVNAHPHLSYDGKFAVVHNGIIENHVPLRIELKNKGVEFSSQTDSEVLAHLLAYYFGVTGDIHEAVWRTTSLLEGTFTFVFVTTHDPEAIYGYRFRSPLGFGHIDGLSILASDQTAIAPHTKYMSFAEDSDLVRATPENCKVFAYVHSKQISVERPSIKIDWNPESLSKRGHPDYMIKEIYESPTALETVLRIRNDVWEPITREICNKQICITGSGSAYYAAILGQYYISNLAEKYAIVHSADEFLNLVHLNDSNHIVTISQSGETFDTVEVARNAHERGIGNTAVTNVIGSSCYRLANFVIFQGAGTEISVLCTKSLTSQVFVLYRLAVALAQIHGKRDSNIQGLSADAEKLPDAVESLIQVTEQNIKDIAYSNCHVGNWFFLGRGFQFPSAIESALKFKEVTYLHAEGMPAGFLKHGTISLIDESFNSLFFLPNSQYDKQCFELTMANISEVCARGGKVIIFGHQPRNTLYFQEQVDYIQLPSVSRFLDPLLQLTAGQLLAYHCAKSLGRNVDKPRSLAKSVTVR